MPDLDKTGTEINDAINQQYDGDPCDVTGYDDLQGNAFSGRSNTAPTLRDYAFGIAGGVSYKVLGWAVNDYQDFIVQTSHRSKLNSVLDNHIHYCTPTDGTGSKFKMQVDVIAAGVHGNFAAVTGSPFTKEIDITADLTNTHALSNLCDIPAANTTVSSMYFIKVTRIAASADEYSGEVYILFNDGHIENDQDRGSREETVK